MTSAQYKRAVTFLVDGARPDVMLDLASRGELPNISRLFERGVMRSMFSVFPSTTGPAYLPYLTGCFPGTCNVPGIRWFDKPRYARKGWGFGSFRSYCGLEANFFNSDISPNVQMAWERFQKPLSCFTSVTRGLKKSGDPTRGDHSWRFFYGHLTDRWSTIDQAAADAFIHRVKKSDFDFAFVVFPAVDEYSHRCSPFHPRVMQAYRDVDAHVGKIAATLRAAGQLDDTVFAMVSDHGLSETSKHFDIGPWLEENKNLRTLYYSNVFKFRFDAVSMISGNGMAHLYFKNQKGWAERTSFEELSFQGVLLDELRYRDEVDLVVASGADGAVHLLTKSGHGFYTWDENGKVHYKFDRDDPLGIFQKNDSRLQGGFTFDQGLSFSQDSHFPDVFRQMEQIFRSPRTGDVIVSAKTGHDLRERYEHPIHKASHGSICPEHMRVPFFFSHPVADQSIRSVDLYPTMLNLMGQNSPVPIDGKIL